MRPVLLLAAVFATGCLSEESGLLRDPASDAAGRLHPAVVSCSTIAEQPAAITASATTGTPRTDRLAEKLALFTSGALVAPETLYQRVRTDLAAIRGAHPAFAAIDRGGCYVPDSLWLMFDDDAFAAVQAGTYREWDALNAALRGSRASTLVTTQSVILEFDGLYNVNRLAREYGGLDGVTLAGANHRVGGNTRACVAQRSFYNVYFLGLGSGDCPSGCTRWRYLGVVIDDQGRLTTLGEYDTATMSMPAWFERAADCRALLLSPQVG